MGEIIVKSEQPIEDYDFESPLPVGTKIYYAVNEINKSEFSFEDTKISYSVASPLRSIQNIGGNTNIRLR